MKRYHLLSLFFITSSIILSITSLTGTSVPWSVWKEYYPCNSADECGPGYGCDNGKCTLGGLQIYFLYNFGLTQYAWCVGASGPYDPEYDDQSCYEGGQVIVTISAVGIVFLVGAFGLIYVRARDGTFKMPTCIVTLIAAVCFLICWAYWFGGCGKWLSELDGKFDLAVGFYLSLISFLLSLFALILQAMMPASSHPSTYARTGTGTAPAETPTPMSEAKSEAETSTPTDTAGADEPSDRPARPSHSLNEPPPQDLASGAAGYTPTSCGKIAHLLCLLCLLTSFILAIVSIASNAIPWTRYQRTVFEPGLGSYNVIVRAGLLNFEECIGQQINYNDIVAIPTVCTKAGKGIVASVSLGVVVGVLLLCTTYSDGRGYSSYRARNYSVALNVVMFGLFIWTWSLWKSKSGCMQALSDDGALSFVPPESAGWILMVVAWVLVLSSLFLQLYGVASKRGSRQTASGHGQIQQQAPTHVHDGYTALIDADVPFL